MWCSLTHLYRFYSYWLVWLCFWQWSVYHSISCIFQSRLYCLLHSNSQFWISKHIILNRMTRVVHGYQPSEEFEFTANSLSAHIKFTDSSFWGHLDSSQWTHKMSSHCELAVSFPWVCNSHSELTATTAWWAHWVISRIAHSKLTLWVANSRKAHSKLTVWVILRVHCQATECPQNEPIMSFNMSSLWVSCELKFFTKANL